MTFNSCYLPAKGNWNLIEHKTYRGHSYACFGSWDNSITWPKAKEVCESIGGYLACIESDTENSIVSEESQPPRERVGQ